MSNAQYRMDTEPMRKRRIKKQIALLTISQQKYVGRCRGIVNDYQIEINRLSALLNK